MFEDLGAHARIAVTGPQRSGTTIAAKMIASDTGFRYVDEFEFGIYNEAAWREVLREPRIVVQCPHMLKMCVDDPPPDTLVVLMRRDLSEIHASETRIGWEAGFQGNTHELARFGLTEGDSAQLKYRYWDEHPRPEHHLELDYAALGRHELYLEAGRRVGFESKQTTVDDVDPPAIGKYGIGPFPVA